MQDYKYISAKEAAAILDVSKRVLYDLVKQGKIRANKVNQRVIYYSYKSILEYMSGQSFDNIND